MTRRNQQQWQELMKQFEASGLDQRNWCSQQGINLLTFRDRLSKIRGTGGKPDKTADPIEAEIDNTNVQWIEISSKNEIFSSNIESIEVQIDKFKINLGTNFNEKIFADICKVLKCLC